MNSSMKMALILAVGAAVAFVGCTDAGGSGGDDKGGSSRGGSGGKGSAGSGGNSGVNGGNTGTAGMSGSGNSGGSGGSGGQNQAGTSGGGNGGNAPSAGAGGEDPGAGGSGNAGGAGGTPGACELDGSAGTGGDFGAGGGAGDVVTTVVLLDNVVMTDVGGTTTVKQWQFTNGDTIDDSTTAAADIWSRPSYNAIASAAGAHNEFFECGVDETTNGSMRNVIPFTDKGQWYEVRVPFAFADYSGHHVSADVKLVSGGCELGVVLAELFVLTTSSGMDPFPSATGAPIDLSIGVWKSISVDIPEDTYFEETDAIGLRVHTHACNP